MKSANTFINELKNGELNGRMVEIYGCHADKTRMQRSVFIPLPAAQRSAETTQTTSMAVSSPQA